MFSIIFYSMCPYSLTGHRSPSIYLLDHHCIVERWHGPGFMDNGSRPVKWHPIHQARKSTAATRWGGTGEGLFTNGRRGELKRDRREKGISVCMALKLINRDETASVIKTGSVRVRDVVFHSDVCVYFYTQVCVFLCVIVCIFVFLCLCVWNVCLSENEGHACTQRFYKWSAIARFVHPFGDFYLTVHQWIPMCPKTLNGFFFSRPSYENPNPHAYSHIFNTNFIKIVFLKKKNIFWV